MQRHRLPIRLTCARHALCLGLLLHTDIRAQPEGMPLPTVARESASAETPVAVFEEIW